MNEKHAEFYGLPCRMFLVFRSKKTHFCVSFHDDQHAECSRFLDCIKLNLVYYFMNEKHAEFSGLPCIMFWVFRSMKTQFCVSFHA